MEALSRVRTILGIVHDILSAVETASRSKSRCKKVAERVRCIKDILEQAAAARDDDDDDAATRRLLRRLKKALRRALQEVRRCQRSGSFLVRSVSAIVAGGRAAADPLDAVEADIDRCVIDLTLAYSLRIARDKNGNENKRNKLVVSAESVVVVPDGDKMMDTTATTAIGVPVCTATAAVVHEMVPPPPSYGYYGHCCSCWSYHYHSYYWRNHGYACDNAGGGPSYASFYPTHQYSSYHPSMFSDYDPNSCSMM